MISRKGVAPDSVGRSIACRQDLWVALGVNLINAQAPKHASNSISYTSFLLLPFTQRVFYSELLSKTFIAVLTSSILT